MNFVKIYVWNLLISLDQFANAVLAGDPDETISSRCGKRIPICRFCRAFCRIMDKIDPRHCHKSIEADEGKGGAA